MRILTILALAAGFAGAACSGGDPRPPNVVVIVVDTLRADHADPAAGRARTPALDALARDGVRFSLAFAHQPVTLPAHVALFSSRQPFEAGVRLNAVRVPDGVPLLPDWLHAHGYRGSAVVSLASLWPVQPGRGLDRGVDRYVYEEGGTDDCLPADVVNDRLGPVLDDLDGGEPFFLLAHYSDPHEPYNAHGTIQRSAEVLLDGEHLATRAISEFGFAREVLRLEPGEHVIEIASEDVFEVRRFAPRASLGQLPLRWEEGRPNAPLRSARVRLAVPGPAPAECDLWLWLQDVPEGEELARRYRLEAEYADRQIGLFLDELRRRGLYEESLIVFTSDHGEALGEHGHVGHVDNLYDELLHVPLVIKPPAGHPSLARLAAARDGLVRHVDVAPTVLEIAGLPPLPDQRGRSLLSAGRGVLLAETHRPMAPRELYALRDERHKLIFAPGEERFELYDLVEDPSELRDLFATRGREFLEWQERLRAVASAAEEGSTEDWSPDEETAARLRALGY